MKNESMKLFGYGLLALFAFSVEAKDSSIAKCIDSSLITIVSDNAELIKIVSEDQEIRNTENFWKMDAKEIELDDSARRSAVLKLLRSGKIRTDNDYFNAAIIFQHGTDPGDVEVAFALATLSNKINPEYSGARWLASAAFDRFLLSKKQPQWYGTQMKYDFSNNLKKLFLEPINKEVVTDAERVERGVGTLDEIYKKIEMRNNESICNDCPK